MNAAVANDVAAWERLSRQASLAVSTCDDLLAEIDGMLTGLGRGAARRSAGGSRLSPPASPRTWPAQFPTYGAWLAWCEQDRREEALENTLAALPW